MARHMSMLDAAHGLLSRVTSRNLDATLRRTPAGFIQRYANKWQYLAGAANTPGVTANDAILRKQYCAIRHLLAGYGYNYPDNNEPEERFEQLNRACFSILGKSTKSDLLWNQLTEREPVFLDAYVIVNLWVWNVADARAERNNLSWAERENRILEQEMTRTRKSIAMIDDEIQMNQRRITQLTTINEQLTQQRDDLTRTLWNMSPDADSDPPEKPLADSGNPQRRSRPPAGDSGPEKMQKIE